MKNTKEARAILTAIYCINFTSEHKDDDINKIIEYAFMRLFESNTRLITLPCIGKTKDQIMPEIKHLLEADTEYYRHQNRRN